MKRYVGKVIVDKLSKYVAITCDRGFLSYKNEMTFCEFMSIILKETESFIKKHTYEQSAFLLNELISILDSLETDGDYDLFYYQDLFKNLLNDLQR